MWGAGRRGGHVESVFWRGLGPAWVSEEPVIRPTSQEAFSYAQHVSFERDRERDEKPPGERLQEERDKERRLEGESRFPEESKPWPLCFCSWGCDLSPSVTPSPVETWNNLGHALLFLSTFLTFLWSLFFFLSPFSQSSPILQKQLLVYFFTVHSKALMLIEQFTISHNKTRNLNVCYLQD